MENKKEVAKNILMALGILGIIPMVMLAPGLAKILPLLQKIDTARINQELKRLHKRGLVEIIKHKNGITSIKLTKKGKEKLKRYEIDNLKTEKPTKWDKKWRIIIFDISIKKNFARDLLRRRMKKLGFYKLQSSVFVHPYPCYEIVIFIREYFDVNDEVKYIEAEKIENDDKLIEYFFT
ncbi:MAG: hypothetical protein ACD_30C00040G0012 [uncultured bacterium]|uniref:Transcriptional regulator, PaaX family n=4 Tax=Candidatus Daviesiibacteriota TaxID=1752718 RepID=A0A0G0HDK9_9BACT|nr:MAG: hypothetical protein ACD_30C00040G0012 [uncultured bacterium]KKQ10184.1 MAG: Transcriptional regulator, PaaX family [Candidatus Daviesbacteria bacterium GW2011_GWB1_36_5]KKQ15068.1 MAG: Transcriptional regulator, PaaX family [Candidatus Daviesbacteria bacterium GW2011_GWA1_36_8]OGE17139.1 MAG: hypothetical protein A2858_00345 [Candidatus Daviesbacteria bacterium RIFCSPHIGHO2_01_FULL_36_37]OGE35920.1 MAG: hypothetical protein A3E66_01340 [Candidatus Daviesbacteria bacterium RIFCSPHIGHO2_